MSPDEIARLFCDAQWDTIASHIDTGTDNPDTSRALIVFNPTTQPIMGTAVFHVDMPWREGRELTPVRVSYMATGVVCQSGITEAKITPALPGETHGRILFDLLFDVQNAPALSWDTYIAEYVDGYSKNVPLDPTSEPSQLIVVETSRHDGVLDQRWKTAPG